MAANIPVPRNGGSSPQSVEKITRIAQDYEYNNSVPLRYWLRTAATLLRELVLVKLSKHPDALKNENDRKALVAAEKEVEQNLAKLEVLKPRINKRYERHTRLMRERQSRKSSSDAISLHEPRELVSDPALAGVAEPLEAGANRDLAVRLAQTELSRRATVRKANGQSSGLGDDRRAAGVWGDWEDALTDIQSGDRDLSQRMQNIRSNIERGQSTGHTQRAPKPTVRTVPTVPTVTSTAYKYPSVPRSKPFETTFPSPQIAIYDKNVERHGAPILPPKEQVEPSRATFVDGTAALEPPPRPSKLSPGPPPPGKEVADNGTSTGSDLNPSSYTFKPSAYLENGSPLRSMFLPASLRSRFLSLAASNTRRNLETCGILCGTLVSNALFISRLLIPEQTSTSDTCETTNESAIFEYCDSEDLIMLGWIHTHPSQTCFMSSRDLHTHSGYQVMLPESIAIVCAPSKNPDWGCFV
ncbi:hypothetical protein N7492_006515 [Penicillium capsulatum]|uniref:MPN domain-containing protein n=1 Tax=Penicillium capsulatum TaxID=69766 RepID=A0A9W9HY63_9EURO|nr:hypothetical protein N7492_006515 [Penicillium capsulatum]